MSELPTPPYPSSAPTSAKSLLNLPWILTLRWAAVFGQLATIGVAEWFFDAHLAWIPLLAIIAATAVTNIGVFFWFRWIIHHRPPATVPVWGDRAIASIMALDVVFLTLLLYWTGGPSNPFALFYLVNVALAGVVLEARWAWCIHVGAIVCFAGLFLWHRPLEILNGDDAPSQMVARQGLLVAFGTSATVIIYFITRLTDELRRRGAELRQAEQRQARADKLEALATLAAGAAHELATPLSTIAVIIREMELQLAKSHADDEIQQDAATIRGELARCREILDRMSAGAGQSAGESVVALTPADIVADAMVGLTPREVERIRRRLDFDPTAAPALRAPRQALGQALRGLVHNALEASEPDKPIELAIRRDGSSLAIVVRDWGIGMAPEVRARAGEPFFTTKDPGRGMGLGLFLARTLIERLDGTLEIRAPDDGGTQVEVRLPIADSRRADQKHRIQ